MLVGGRSPHGLPVLMEIEHEQIDAFLAGRHSYGFCTRIRLVPDSNALATRIDHPCRTSVYIVHLTRHTHDGHLDTP